MWWFLYKKYVPGINIFYDGTNSKLLHNEKEGKLWLDNSHAYERKNVIITKLWSKHNFTIPIWDGQNITTQFKEYLLKCAKNKTMDDIMFSLIIEFLKEYDVVDVWWFPLFKEKDSVLKEDSMLPDMGLLLMKMFIEWFYRFKPIKYKTNKSKTWYIDVPIGQDYKWEQAISYKYKWKDYKTNIFGVYAPAVWTAMFSDYRDFWWGRVLQKWQLNALYNLGRITYIAASRRSGKTFMLGLIASIMEMKEWFSLSERGRAVKINYIGITDEANETVVEYILDMAKKFMSDKIFNWKGKQKILEFLDWDVVVWRIKFLSAEGKIKGRGTYADMIILDEAAYLDYKIFKTNLPIVTHQWAIMVCISTIDPETKKNWFYNKLVAAEAQQLSYAPIDEQIVAIWKKYGMDKCEMRKDIKMSNLVAMKKEIRSLRKDVWLRYTIDDIEYMTESEKAQAKADAVKEWLWFYYAELYSQFLDESSIFSTNGNTIHEDDIADMKFDTIVLWFDTATQLDNPALCVVWVNKKKAYVLESTILDKNSIDSQINFIKRKRLEYKNKLKKFDVNLELPLVVDVTSAPQHTLQNIELRDLYVTMPVQYTPWSIKKRNGRFHLIPKDVLVKEWQEFFKQWNILLSSKCNGDWWLVNEIDNFQVVKLNGRKEKYEAISGHDDQVNAMMLALDYIYTYEWFNVIMSENEWTGKEMTVDDYLEMKEKYQSEKNNEWVNWLMRKYWF